MDKESLTKILEKMGFEEEVIEDILSFVDTEIDIKYLYEKVKYLADLKFTDRIIRIIVEENPLFLTTELKDIQAVVEYFKEKGLEKYLINIVEVNPDILSTSVEKIRQNEKILKIIIGDENKIQKLLIDRSEILTYNNDYLADRIRLLVENGLKETIEKIIMLYPETFELEDDELDLKNLKQKV